MKYIIFPRSCNTGFLNAFNRITKIISYKPFRFTGLYFVLNAARPFVDFIGRLVLCGFITGSFVIIEAILEEN